MKAVGLTEYLSIDDKNSLRDIELSMPVAAGRDILVKVKAISVNPVDTKVRSPKDVIEKTPRILGWDASGTIVAVGESVTAYQIGDDVFYAGDITRSGCNAEFHLVDERIVGHKPSTLSHAEAAALPLTSITAWEALFDRLRIKESDSTDNRKSILIIGGAGGVGSIAIQLAKKIAGLTVIATASREETISWCKDLGADLVVNHRNNLLTELSAIKYPTVDYILCLNDTDGHWSAMSQLITPQGTICTIVENQHPLDMSELKTKSATFVWEFMFTRSMYQTDDMASQRDLLNNISKLIDEGILRTTLTQTFTPINAENLRNAHGIVEKGKSIGKIVVAN